MRVIALTRFRVDRLVPHDAERNSLAMQPSLFGEQQVLLRVLHERHLAIDLRESRIDLSACTELHDCGRDGCFRIVELRRHYERLQRSARLLHIPFDTSCEAYEAAIFQLAAALLGTIGLSAFGFHRVMAADPKEPNRAAVNTEATARVAEKTAALADLESGFAAIADRLAPS